MTGMEVLDVWYGIPHTIKDLGIIVLVLSFIEISPIKLNPWKWCKAFIALPSRLEALEHEFNDDRAFRWRQMIVNRGDRVQDGYKLRKEVWKDTIETIDNYEKYCDKHPEFRNELATITIEYMRHKYQEALDHNLFL